MTQDEGSSERSPLLRHPKDAARSAVRHAGEGLDFFAERQLDSDEEAEDLRFDDPDEEEEDAYQRSRTLHFGDYAYPNIDINREEARNTRWQQDDEIVHRRRRKGTISKKDGSDDAKHKQRRGDEASGSQTKQAQSNGDADGAGKGKAKNSADDRNVKTPQKGDKDGSNQSAQPDAEHSRKSTSPWLAWDRESQNQGKPNPDDTHHDSEAAESSETSQPNIQSNPESQTKGPDPYGAVDLVIEDYKAEERERLLERRRGDPALCAGKGTRIFRKQYTPTASGSSTPTTEHKKHLVEHHGSPSTPLNPPASTAAAVTVQPANGKGNVDADANGGLGVKKVQVELEDSTAHGDVGNTGDSKGNVLVSREIDVQENQAFLRGRVLSPEPHQQRVDEVEGENPWA
ncbi:hypothetical protein [Sporisorium scitamineum]|nr:hypothetical protein [Sporisorium scitamineum]